jgi:hypothetical protein
MTRFQDGSVDAAKAGAATERAPVENTSHEPVRDLASARSTTTRCRSKDPV